MSILSRLYPQFYELYRIQELEKNEIKKEMNITESMYTNLVKEIKKREITEINTEILEQICCKQLNANPNDPDTLKMALEIWKYKHKIPTEKSILDVDL